MTDAPPLARPWWTHPALLAALAVAPFLALVLPHLGFAPIWDGAVYGDCLADAAGHGFSLWKLNCSGHPSMAYMGLLGAAYKLGGGLGWPVLLVNALLGAGAVLAFQSVAKSLYPEANPLDRALLAATLGAVPPFAASALNLNVDFGVLVFFLFSLAALLQGRFVLSMLAGLGLAFSKEPGIAILALTTGLHALTFVFLAPLSRAEKRRRFAPYLWFLAVPLAFGAYLLARRAGGEALLWSDNPNGSVLADLITFRPADPVFLSFLACIFVLNFQWIPTLLVLAAAGRRLRALIRREPRALPATDLERARGPFVFLLLATSTYLLTRHRTFSNVRYFLPIVPVLLLAAFHAGRALLKTDPERRLIAGLTLALFLVSAQRTVDPLSRAIYGTFPWGSHRLLEMTSVTGECCGHSRDQLVYDLEFLQFDALLDEALAAFPLEAHGVYAMARLADWYTLSALTPTSPPRRTLVRPGTQRPDVWTVNPLLRLPAPSMVVWLDLAYVEGGSELGQLLGRYRIEETRTFERHGYTLRAVVLRPR